MKKDIQKIICIFVLVASLVSCMPFAASAASTADTYCLPAEGQRELLLNGDFEKTDSGEAKYWALAGGSWNAEPGATLVQDVTYGGSANAVKLVKTDSGDAVRLTHKVRTIPGSKYQISFWVNATSVAGASIKYTLEYTTNSGAYVSGYSGGYSLKPAAAGEWVQYVHHFTAEGVKNGITNVRIRLGSGAVYVDAASLYAIEVPADTDDGEADETVQVVPDFTFSKPCAGGVELLENGGFELPGPGTKMTGWAPYGNTWTKEVGPAIIEKTEDPAHVRTGERAIRITTNLYEERRYVSDWVKLEPGAMYQASVWVNIEEIGSANVRFSMAYWNTAHTKNPGGHQSGEFRYTNKIGEWVQFVAHFEALELGDNEVQFRIDQHGGDGVIYFDDASLYMIKPAKKMDFSTNEVFYYTEAEQGLMSAVLNTEKYEEIQGGTVDFRIRDGETVVEEKLGASSAGDNTARYIFNLTGLTVGKAYTAEAVLRNASGEIVETQTETIQRHLPRPTALTEEGFYKIQVQDADGRLTDKLDENGNPELLDVVIAYTRPEENADLTYLKEQGATAFIQPAEGDITKDSVGEALDAAHLLGLKAVVGLYPDMKPAGYPTSIERTTYYVNTYKNHPAVLGWAVLDEPSAYFKWPELDALMEASYTLLRRLDPVHPVYAVEATTEQLPLISRYVDILASDPYPYDTRAISGNTAKYLRAAAEATGFAKPTCSIVQIFTTDGYFPTATEARHFFYESLFEGASMLGYYKFTKAAGSKDLNETDIWDALVKWGTAGEQRDAFDHFVYRKYPVFCESAEIGAEAWYSGFVKDESLYMVILNMNEAGRTAPARTVDIPLQSDGGAVEIRGFTATLTEGEGTAQLEGEGSTLSVPLLENAAVVYKITPHAETDFSALKTSPFRDLGRHGWAAEQIRSLTVEGILEGITKTSFRPGFKETSETFISSLADILDISGVTLLSAAGTDEKDELSRQKMMDIVRLALQNADMEEDIALDVAGTLGQHMARGNIDAAVSMVSRAEAAVVLDRLLEWIKKPDALRAEKSELHVLDVQAAAPMLLSENGTAADGFWYSLTETADGAYVAIHNGGEAGTTSVPITAEAAQLLYGSGAVSFSGSTMQAEVPANSTMLLRVYTKAPFGLYDENLYLVTHAKAGMLTAENASGTAWIAVYQEHLGKKELLYLTKDSLQFTPDSGSQYIVSAFDWTETQTPQGKAYTVRSGK